MGLIDLLAGLSFVAGHIGLARLDRGLRDSLEIPTEQLQAHVTLLARNAQIVTLTNQVQQLRGEASRLQKQRLNAQHAQLMVQVGQLQVQLQQLHTERKRLELEEQRELRLAQENRIMRLFVDTYEQAQTYRLQGQSLDYLVVTLAAFRLYRQVYNDLDDARNRLKLAELRERLFVSVRDLLVDSVTRERLARDYAGALRQAVEAVSKAQQAESQAQKLLGAGQAAEAASASWTDAFSQAGAGIANLQVVRQALEAAQNDLGALKSNGEWREFFFPLQPDQTGGMLTAVTDHWQSWVAAINVLAGRPLAEVYRGLDQLPGQLEQTLKQVDTAVDQSQDRRVNYQLAEVLTRLGEVLPAHTALYQQLRQQFMPLRLVPQGATSAALLDGVFELQQIQANLMAWFDPLRTYLDASRHAGDTRYQAEVARRVAALSPGSSQVSAKTLPEVFTLYQEAQTLNTAISRSMGVYLGRLRRALATDAEFQRLRARAQELSSRVQVEELDRLAAQAPDHWLKRVEAALHTQRQKQTDQRWRWVEHFLRLHPPATIGPSGELTPKDPFPTLTSPASISDGKPLAPLTPAGPLSRGDKKWYRPVLFGAISTVCICITCVAILLPSVPSAAAQATGTARAQVTVLAIANLTKAARPADTAAPTQTSTATIRPSNTPTPTATATESPTSTLDPSITPPTATPTPTETQTPTATSTSSATHTATETATATQTRTPTPAPVGMLPGLKPNELVADVEDLGYACDLPDYFWGVYSWWCERTRGDKHFSVEIWSRTLDTVDSVRGTVLHLDLAPNDELSMGLLGYVASLQYTGALPEQARAWVERTLPTITENGDVRSNRFGGVVYELYGWPNARNLIIGTYVEP
jgi:hypothetical protein